jgi:hypothetical protein
MFETSIYRGPVAQVDEPHDRRLVILSSILVLHVLLLRSSGTGIQRRRKKFLKRTNADPTQAGSGPENNSDSEKIALIALLSELPSNKNKALQEPTKASAQVELEGSFDMTTSSLQTEQESTSSNCDLKATRDALTFHWFQEPENWGDLCPPQEEVNKKDIAERHAKLYSSLERRKEKRGPKRQKRTFSKRGAE